MNNSSCKTNLRKTGIPLVGDVSWGTHFCQFYETKEDLLDILVPYFKAGLENNEFCMWVTSEPLDVADAREAMQKAFADFDQCLKKGQIEIIPYTAWYVLDGSFDAQRVLKGWVDKLDRALAQGYEGLRLTGNTFWLEKENWRKFTDYEEEINRVIGRYPMLAVCTYSLRRCGASEVVDVVNNHQFALIKRRDVWESMVSSGGKRAEQELKEKEKRYRSLFDAMTEGFALHEIVCDDKGDPCDYRFLEINPAFENLTGLKRENVVGQLVSRVLPKNDPYWVRIYGKVALTGEPVHFENYSSPLKRHFEVFAYSPAPLQFAVLFVDITERKLMERELARLASFPELNPNPVVETDFSGVFYYMNPAAKRMFPGPEKEKMGHVVMQDVKAFSKVFQEEGRNVVVREASCGGRWCQMTYSFVRDLGRIRVYMMDITERKLVEEALRENQKDLNRAQAVAQVGSWRLNVQRNELLWSDENHRIFGIPKGTSMSYETFLSCVHPDDRDYVDGMWRAGLKGDHYDIVHRVVVAGQTKWVRERAELEFDGQGKLLGGFGTTQDITARKQAEGALVRAKEEWERTFDSVPDLISILDAQHRILRVNAAMAQKLGRKPEECIGLPCYKSVHGLLEAPDFCPHARTLKDGRQHIEEVHEEHLGGDFLVSTTPLFDDKGKMIGTVHVAHDITERRRAEEVLKRDKKDLERLVAEQAKRLFEVQMEAEKTKRLTDIGILAATVAHELRNPLAAMRIASFNLKRKANNPNLQGHLTTIENKINESDQIINNLLFYSRLRIPHFEQVKLHDILSEIVKTEHSHGRNRKVKLGAKIASVAATTLEVDPLQLKELIINIINNAYDALSGKEGRIEIGADVVDRCRARITVKDNGIGISDEDMDRIWEPFYSTKSKGTGLGLSVCRQIAESHNGIIEVESEQGKGTTIIVTLPLKQAAGRQAEKEPVSGGGIAE
ncbi:MAG: MEDS domain-containing protein [Candidatus Omnitrophica bacterium]|nr:MEDS domain-containing protein [Candidatus Omnitrophota bacterium]